MFQFRWENAIYDIWKMLKRIFLLIFSTNKIIIYINTERTDGWEKIEFFSDKTKRILSILI